MRHDNAKWRDFLSTEASRRDFVRLGGAVTGLLSLGTLTGCGRARAVLRTDLGPFPYGVASGDPTADSVILWTRLGSDLVSTDGQPIEVTWELADSDTFQRVVRTGSATALPDLGYSLHADVQGLDPAREYFFRWMAGGETSPVGRTRTAQDPALTTDRFRFAFASCQQYEHGYYTAYRHMAEENLDLIVHLGDYIYEETWGSNLVRHHEGPEIHTLEEYRARYGTYRSDPDLQEAHRSAPWIVTWDDHEVDNNYAAAVPEDSQSRAEFMLRRAAAYQAFYEFMPIRLPTQRQGPDMRIYRRHHFGSLIDMHVLDTRQYRTDQACGDGRKPTCDGHWDPNRTLLGEEQRAWLFDGLESSTARWNVLAQQVMMTHQRGENDAGQQVSSMDAWDGYPHERGALMQAFSLTRAENPVVLTGDVHTNWAADLKEDFASTASANVGTEFVGTSISSGGDGEDIPSWGERAMDANPHIKFCNAQRGYVSLTATPTEMTAAYRVVPRVTEPGADVFTKATFVAEAGNPGAQEA